MPPRRFTTLVLVIAVLATAATIFSTSAATRQVAADIVEPLKPSSDLRDRLPDFEIPKLRFSWHKSAHKPPEQKNSTNGETSWYSDWRWLNPFSSSVTLDEDRTVLPPLPERPPVYTYYDDTGNKDTEVLKIEQELLLIWKRAWWAHKFRPVILTSAEAMQNPLYEGLHRKGMPVMLEFEFMRWLAWDHMGTGLLASWHCVPMSTYNDPLLSYLRRGQYEKLTKFQGLGSGLFAGEKSQINSAIKGALDDVKLSTHKEITDAIDDKIFRVEKPTSIANYNMPTISKKYPVIAKQYEDEPYKARIALNKLITSHLHTIWQNTFSSGIQIIKPLPAHTTALVEPAQNLAKLLAECPDSILQSSCPPNNPNCSPCVGRKFMITTSPSFKNSSTLYTISIVPHPLTMITLNNGTNDITIPYIRRHTERDTWISALTRDVLGAGRGGPSRVISLKDAVASDYGRSRSLWLTTEHFPTSFSPPPPPPKSPTNDARPAPVKIAPFPEDWLEELDWHFGFAIPRTALSHGESLPPVPGPERWKGPAGMPAERRKPWETDPPTSEELTVEVDLLKQARRTINSKDKDLSKMRGIAEVWNLADTEAWKFVRAYRARDLMEKKLYDQEEASFDGPGVARGSSRWW